MILGKIQKGGKSLRGELDYDPGLPGLTRVGLRVTGAGLVGWGSKAVRTGLGLALGHNDGPHQGLGKKRREQWASWAAQKG
jgi:hypothetical protein